MNESVLLSHCGDMLSFTLFAIVFHCPHGDSFSLNIMSRLRECSRIYEEDMVVLISIIFSFWGSLFPEICIYITYYYYSDNRKQINTCIRGWVGHCFFGQIITIHAAITSTMLKICRCISGHSFNGLYTCKVFPTPLYNENNYA